MNVFVFGLLIGQNRRSVRMHFNNDVMWITIPCLVTRYKNDMFSSVTRYDSIQRLEIDTVTFLLLPKTVKEKVCFCAVVEEVKQRKSSILWTPQTFSSRPRFSLCGRKHRLKISRSPAASCRDPSLSEETLLTQHTRAEHQRMTWSNLYNY